MTKLKTKYDVDKSDTSSKYAKLLFLKDLNENFINMQIEYEKFIQAYFS